MPSAYHRWLYEELIYRNLAFWMVGFGVAIAILFNTMHDVLKRGWLAELRQTLVPRCWRCAIRTAVRCLSKSGKPSHM